MRIWEIKAVEGASAATRPFLACTLKWTALVFACGLSVADDAQTTCRSGIPCHNRQLPRNLLEIHHLGSGANGRD